MKTCASPRTVAFLLLGLLSPCAAGNQERQAVKNIKSVPVAEHDLPAPPRSLAVGVTAPAESDSEARRLRTRAVPGKAASRELTRYEVDPQSFSKGLAAFAVAQRKLAGR
jgi:hypothetical protein